MSHIHWSEIRGADHTTRQRVANGQSVALGVPDTLLAILERGPVVIGLRGHSVQATYTCRAKLPEEIPGDLTILCAALR